MKKTICILVLVLIVRVLAFAQPEDSMIIGIWLAEYSGFDPQTQSNITVKRRLIFEPEDKIYYDTLWGQPTELQDIIFEMEIGNWEIEAIGDSIVFTPTISKRMDIANPDSLVEYDHGVHKKELSSIFEYEWEFHDDNMNVDYTMNKEEIISIPGTPAGNTAPVVYEEDTYITSGAESNIDHDLEYSFSWDDGTGSDWSPSKSASHYWTTPGMKKVTVTARCELHQDRTGTSDTLYVNVTEVTEIPDNNKANDTYSFKLLQDYPVNLNSSVIISYFIPEKTPVIISVYNIHGQSVKSLINRVHSTGYYEIFWDGTDDNGNNVNSGVYLFKLKTKDCYNIQKSTFIR